MEGEVKLAGELTHRLNPPDVNVTSGINIVGMSANIRVGENGDVSVRLVGRASYHARTASYTLDVEPTERLLEALQGLINHHADEVHRGALHVAAEALGVATTRGEL